MAVVDDNRERILAAAEQLLRRFGPEKFRIVDVAQALSMSHGNIYRYFSDKKAITDTIAQRWLGKITDSLQTVAARRIGAATRLEEWVLTLMKLKRQKAKADPEMFRTYCAIAEASREVVAEHIQHLVAQLAEIIRSGTETSEWNVRSPARAAEIILNATIIFHHPAFVARPGSQPTEASARDTLKLLVAGLRSGVL